MLSLLHLTLWSALPNHLSTQQTSLEHLLCARHWEENSGQNRQRSSLSWSSHLNSMWLSFLGIRKWDLVTSWPRTALPKTCLTSPRIFPPLNQNIHVSLFLHMLFHTPFTVNNLLITPQNPMETPPLLGVFSAPSGNVSPYSPCSCGTLLLFTALLWHLPGWSLCLPPVLCLSSFP